MPSRSARSMTRRRMLSPFREADHAHDDCVAAALARAERECERRGQRLTPLRRRVLELVWRGHEPVKAYDLLGTLRTVHRGAAPPTIYRALEFLVRGGFVHRIESMNAYVGCGEPTRAHSGQFWICRECGAVAEMDDDELTMLLTRKAQQLGFGVDRETVEIRGVCRGCRERSRAERAGAG